MIHGQPPYLGVLLNSEFCCASWRLTLEVSICTPLAVVGMVVEALGVFGQGQGHKYAVGTDRGSAMVSGADIGLVLFLVLGLAARSNLLAASAAILLVLRLVHLTFLLSHLYQPALEVGLLFLMLAMLAPFALGKVRIKEIGQSFITIPGIMALLGGAIATHLNGHGIHLLNHQSYLMIDLIVGSILGIVLFKGIPVGPLMAAGITYLMLEGIALIGQWFK